MNSAKENDTGYKVKSIIKNKTLSLRRVSLKNIQKLYRELTSPGVLDNLSLDIESLPEFRRYLLFLTQQWNYNNTFCYIIYISSNTPIGMITLFELNFTHNRAEIGIWIGKSHQKKGYAGKTLGMIIKYAFEDLRLNRLEAHIFPGNSASVQLFTQVWFQKEGILKEYVKKDGGYVDVITFALLKKSIKGKLQNSD